MVKNDEIKCPKCGHSFPLEEVYKQEIENKVAADYENKINQAKKEATESERKANEQQQSVYKRKIDELFNKNLVLEQKTKAQEKLELQVAELMNANQQIQSNVELEVRKAVLNSENELQAKHQKEKDDWKVLYEQQQKNNEVRIRAEIEDKINLQYEHKQREESEKLDIKHKLELKERDEKLSQANKSLEEAQRKIQQNSMQVQGEAQEKFLTEILQELFPDDKIERKTTGAEESDIKQIVIDKIGYQNVECGIIQYESKNTKTWSNAWIDKLIADGETVKADILVLVTQTMPANNKELHRIKNVWICPVKDIKTISNIMRQALIEIHKAKGSQINKADKMEKLYDFMLSQEFRNYMNNIYKGIAGIKSNYEKEKAALTKLWKQREKEFDSIMDSCQNLIGSVMGIGVNMPELAELDIKTLVQNNELDL